MGTTDTPNTAGTQNLKTCATVTQIDTARWHTRDECMNTFGWSRRTFYRRLERGLLETKTTDRGKIYRLKSPVPGDTLTLQSASAVPKSSGTPAQTQGDTLGIVELLLARVEEQAAEIALLRAELEAHKGSEPITPRSRKRRTVSAQPKPKTR